MKHGATERYRPRMLSDLGQWDIDPLKLKIYGMVAEGKEITEAVITDARVLVREEVPPHVAAEGEDNGLGFVIIYPGRSRRLNHCPLVDPGISALPTHSPSALGRC